jgi:hypothetical protein
MATVLERRLGQSASTTSPLIEMRGVEKIYRTGKLEFAALRGVDLVVGPGEMVAVVGPSGSGKTTILNMITGIDRPTRGEVLVAGADLNSMSEERLARWRGETIGIIFQFFQRRGGVGCSQMGTARRLPADPHDFQRTGHLCGDRCRSKPGERWLQRLHASCHDRAGNPATPEWLTPCSFGTTDDPQSKACPDTYEQQSDTDRLESTGGA